MPTAVPYFLYPFAVDGDAGTISPTGSNSTPVNYQYGWTVPYEYPSTNPSYLPVPRTSFNQVLFDVTSAIQQLQLQGYPLWVSSGAGGPPGYLLYSYVAYDAGSGIQIWESQYGSLGSPNTSTPGADGNWVAVSANAQGVQTGTIIDYAGVYPPAGYLACNGATPLRTTYPRLFAYLVPIQTCNTSGTSLTVTDSSFMYVGMPIEGTGIPANTIIASIISGTSVTMSASAPVATGVPVAFFPWGNGNGSTTFTIPNLQGIVTAGSGGTGIPTQTVTNITQTGQNTGAFARQLVANNLPEHVHNNTVSSTFNLYCFDKIGFNTQYYVTCSNSGNPHNLNPPPSSSVVTSITNVANTTTNIAFNITQPTTLVNKCIKYT